MLTKKVAPGLLVADSSVYKTTKSSVSVSINAFHAQSQYLILLWFVREVAQAIGGEVTVGSGRATCREIETVRSLNKVKNLLNTVDF